METSSLVSLMKRAVLRANLDEETEATLQSIKTTAGRGQRKENEELIMEQEPPKKDSNTRTIKIGYQNITITKKWTLAAIRKDKNQLPHTSGTSGLSVLEEKYVSAERTKTAGGYQKSSIAQASQIEISPPNPS